MSQDSNTDYNQQTESAELRDSQNSALLAASTIIIFSAIYWATQIESVKELLLLAKKMNRLQYVAIMMQMELQVQYF